MRNVTRTLSWHLVCSFDTVSFRRHRVGGRAVSVDSAALKAGATVKATVEEKGGQKVVTAIQVN